MPQVLTTNAIILCPHGGKGTSIPVNPIDSKWTVNDGTVLLDGDSGVVSVLPCVFIPPCGGYQLNSMKLNATQVDGRHVMLVTDFIQSFTGFPLVVKETHQVYDESTPAPVPAGGPPPPLPLELQQTDHPSVTVVPDTLTFSPSAFGSTGQPTTLPMTFSLQSQFPQRWILNLISAPSGQYREITPGEPPNILVAPAGGPWNSSSLIVTVTLAGTFMATLQQGNHYFVLTAINHRGTTNYSQDKLTIGL
jgi:hypothetical protein